MLHLLHESIDDQTRLHTSKRVAYVTQIGRAAMITGDDGSRISCDFVAGADSVRSIVRRQIAKSAATPKSLEWRFSRFG